MEGRGADGTRGWQADAPTGDLRPDLLDDAPVELSGGMSPDEGEAGQGLGGRARPAGMVSLIPVRHVLEAPSSQPFLHLPSSRLDDQSYDREGKIESERDRPS